jgi:hypothetical protein
MGFPYDCTYPGAGEHFDPAASIRKQIVFGVVFTA